ncbi:MAG TPA: tRNA (cytidine(34)-2'-O)-methyltransferase [Phycisphaerales bacterium]|nr:tRNA (cytidine(34)-2'-O)-methyltransferase [Phycisphaerales bacterium]
MPPLPPALPPPFSPLLNVVLHEPEIPNNTGNIGRTCIATGCALHLIRPLGFDTSEKACRRAGLDYWARLRPTEHDGWDGYLAGARPDRDRLWLFTTKASRPVWEADFRPGDHVVFGKETRGLPGEILGAYADRLVALPMVPEERSLNLATAVCAAAYEAIRQMAVRGDLSVDTAGRIVRPAAGEPRR